MRVARIVLLLAAGACALAARAATLTNCMELVTYQSRQCYHVVCTTAQFKGVELCIDETGTGWSVCCHHTNGWGYVASRTSMPAVSYLAFAAKKSTANFTTNDFYVAFSWNPKTPTGGLEDYNGWVHLRSPDGEMEIVASALSTVAGERCLYPDADATDDPVVDSEADKWEWVEENGKIILNDCLLSRNTEGAIAVPSTINGKPVVALRDGVLAGYSLITSITLPDTIREIGPATFEDCSALTACFMSAVTNIGPCAFRDCTLLAAAPLTDGLQKIGDAAFEDCESLKELVCPAALAEIGDFAFRGCVSLTNVTLSTAQTEIERGVFNGCTALATCDIPMGIRTIRDSAFGECTSLLAAKVPFDAEIADDAFPETCALRCLYPWMDVREPNAPMEGVTEVPESAWQIVEHSDRVELAPNCISSDYGGTVCIPERIAGKPVVSIGEDAFADNLKLKGIIIPNSVSNIGYKAISCNEAIQVFVLPDSVTNLDYAACSLMFDLRDLVVGSGLKSCADDAFANCSQLTNVVFRQGCEVVGCRMFAGCNALVSVSIPPSVRRIESEAFYGCESLESVVVPLGVRIADDAFPNGCAVVRAGPEVAIDSGKSYDDDLNARVIRLVDHARWCDAFKVNLLVDGSADHSADIKILSFAGISATRYERQNDGTLDVHFTMPSVSITGLQPTDGSLAVKVSPPDGASIVEPIDACNAVFVTVCGDLGEMSAGNGTEYSGSEITVDSSDYVNSGILRLDLSDVFSGEGSGFFSFSLKPR